MCTDPPAPERRPADPAEIIALALGARSSVDDDAGAEPTAGRDQPDAHDDAPAG